GEPGDDAPAGAAEAGGHDPSVPDAGRGAAEAGRRVQSDAADAGGQVAVREVAGVGGVKPKKRTHHRGHRAHREKTKTPRERDWRRDKDHLLSSSLVFSLLCVLCVLCGESSSTASLARRASRPLPFRVGQWHPADRPPGPPPRSNPCLLSALPC